MGRSLSSLTNCRQQRRCHRATELLFKSFDLVPICNRSSFAPTVQRCSMSLEYAKTRVKYESSKLVVLSDEFL